MRRTAVMTLIALTAPAWLPASAAHAGTPRCLGHRVTIAGTGGDDVIKGTAGPDVIRGFSGNDTIDGRGGDDIICGSSGADVIRGGDGQDTLVGQQGKDSLHGDAGDDRLIGGWVHQKSGVAKSNLLQGGAGDDRLVSEGLDMLDYSDSPNGVDVDLTALTAVGDGTDSMRRTFPLSVTGSDFDDTLKSDALASTGGHSDVIAGAGDDTITGGPGIATIEPGTGANVVQGGSGHETFVLSGDDDPDIVHGGGDQDVFYATSGTGIGPHDQLYGDEGYDLFRIVTDLHGDATLDGGPGNGTDPRNFLGLVVHRFDGGVPYSDVRIDTAAGTVTSGDLTLHIPHLPIVWVGYPAVESAGSLSTDVDSFEMSGNPEVDNFRMYAPVPSTLSGLGGDDALMGGPADDVVDGGPGNDIGSGSGGTDTCISVESTFDDSGFDKSCETDNP